MPLFAQTVSESENLVPNGSFEVYEECPLGMDDFTVKDWYSPTLGSPNYLNVCNNTDAGVPQNSWGYIEAAHGWGYVGIHNDGGLLEYREYIQVKLKKSLTKNTSYKIGFSISLAKISKIACNKIGILLSQYPVTLNNNGVINSNPQIVFSNIIKDTTKWIHLVDTIIPNEEYKYLTIGFFFNNSDLSCIEVNNSTFYSEPYYLIDDVFVEEINEYSIPNVFTPNDDGVNDRLMIGEIPKGFNFMILNRWGNVVFETNNPSVEFWDGTFRRQLCSDGVYFYKITNEEFTTLKTGFIHLIR
ncbi:MAG: gliding motility-associated C-terminal domain-containing protein [Brumimicrobium sp.]